MYFLSNRRRPTQKWPTGTITAWALALMVSGIVCLSPCQTHAQTVDRLGSRPLATPIAFSGDPKQRQITSFEISIPTEDAEGEFQLNQTKWLFDEFGVARPDGEQKTETVEIRFQESEFEESRPGRREDDDVPARPQLYEIEFPDSLACKIYLVLAKSLDNSRLVITDGRQATRVIELSVVREIADEPVPHEFDEVDLTSELFATERGLVNIRIQGELGGPGKFHLDPNRASYNAFGERGMSTLMGWRPRSVNFNHVRTHRETGRELYEIVNDSPRLMRYFLVISKRDGQHRLVVRNEQTVKHVVPMQQTSTPGR